MLLLSDAPNPIGRVVREIEESAGFASALCQPSATLAHVHGDSPRDVAGSARAARRTAIAVGCLPGDDGRQLGRTAPPFC
jgi:hypothetical protein